MIPSVELLDDAVGVGGPDEGFVAYVVLDEVAVDCSLEVDQRAEGNEPATNKKSFTRSNSRCRCWRLPRFELLSRVYESSSLPTPPPARPDKIGLPRFERGDDGVRAAIHSALPDAPALVVQDADRDHC